MVFGHLAVGTTISGSGELKLKLVPSGSLGGVLSPCASQSCVPPLGNGDLRRVADEARFSLDWYASHRLLRNRPWVLGWFLESCRCRALTPKCCAAAEGQHRLTSDGLFWPFPIQQKLALSSGRVLPVLCANSLPKQPKRGMIAALFANGHKPKGLVTATPPPRTALARKWWQAPAGRQG